ncbi:MAG: potassium channel family protein [Cellulosilyticaceae bacterium]
MFEMRMKQFVVFGLGRFGISLATTLAEAGYEVMVVDKSEERIQEISALVTHAVQADAADMDTLRSLGIRNFDVAIVAIGKDIQASIMTTLLLKEIGIPYVVAKASSEIHERVLRKIGADRIILPEHEMGMRIATNLMSGNIIDYIQLSSEYSIVEIAILQEWANRTIMDVNFRAKYGINIIAVQRHGKIDISPTPDYILSSEDVLVVVGSTKQLQLLESARYGK